MNYVYFLWRSCCKSCTFRECWNLRKLGVHFPVSICWVYSSSPQKEDSPLIVYEETRLISILINDSSHILYQLSDYITCQEFAIADIFLQVPSFNDVYVGDPKTNIKSCTDIIKGPFRITLVKRRTTMMLICKLIWLGFKSNPTSKVWSYMMDIINHIEENTVT